MLISCTSCNSKYLLNSAELEPIGRTVECSNCGYQWYQEILLNQGDEINDRNELSEFSESNDLKNQKEKINSPVPNLPSTYVKEQKVSIINSILVIFFIILLISIFWIIRNIDINVLVLLKFYLDEFVFNLKLIFNDFAKIIYQIIN
jgi:predicted Zn finger-like uncharacterized protein